MRRAGLLVLAVFVSANVFGQNRTFVASTGLDTNPCSRTAPCRGFNAAVAAVASGGEVIVLDSAGYGPATITKSVSIEAPSGVYAGVTVTSGEGFTLAVPSGIIALKGLTVTGLGGAAGVFPTAQPAVVNIEACAFLNFDGSGNSGVNVGGPGFIMTVRDCLFRSNTIGVASSGAAISIDHCRFDDNFTGALLTDFHASVRDSIFFGGNTGITFAGFNSAAIATVEGCTFSDMTTGISSTGISQGTAKVRLSDTTIVNTTTAMSGSTFVSFGNNRFDGNTSDGTFSSTIALK